MSAVLNRLSFESTVKILELNSHNKITFVVGMVKANLLMILYEPTYSTLVFTPGLKELDLIKLKLSIEKELKGIIEGNFKLYNDRIEKRFSCKVCNFYESPDDEGFLVSRPFKCTYFFHPKCVTTWKFFGLDKERCFVCKSGLCDIYKDLYDHD